MLQRPIFQDKQGFLEHHNEKVWSFFHRYLKLYFKWDTELIDGHDLGIYS